MTTPDRTRARARFSDGREFSAPSKGNRFSMPTSAWRVDIQRTNGSISTLYGFSMDAAKAHGAMRDTVRSNRCRNIVLKEIVDVYLAPEEEQCAT